MTLVETLATTLILLMVSGIVAAGIPVAKSVYGRIVMASNAEVLLSTTISTLRNELSTAREVQVGKRNGDAPNTIITYYSESNNATSKIFSADSGDKITKSNAAGTALEEVAVFPLHAIAYQRYVSSDPSMNDGPTTYLVSTEASTGDLYVAFDSVTYANGIITFHNLSVNRTNGTTGLAKRDTFSVRVIAG